MKIFLSWSGERSKKMAEALKVWLPDVIQALDPWASTQDIAKGSRGMVDIANELKGASYGIICVTPENQQEQWINFEAGALSKEVETARVVPLLLDLKIAELKGPLTQFQATLSQSKSDFSQLMNDINIALGEQQVPLERLQRTFEKYWDELNDKFEAIKSTDHVVSHDTKRSTEDLLAEILVLTRQQERRLVDIEGAIQRNPSVTNIEMVQSPPKSLIYEVDSVPAAQRLRTKRKLDRLLSEIVGSEGHSYRWEGEALEVYFDPPPEPIDDLREAIRSISRQTDFDISVYKGTVERREHLFGIVRS